jgi:hypothetical protein
MRRLPEYLANQALKFAIPQGLLGFGQLSTLCNCGGKALSQVHIKKTNFWRFAQKHTGLQASHVLQQPKVSRELRQ